jgi:RNA polymerase sigma-70 factor (ECF subfamily)
VSGPELDVAELCRRYGPMVIRRCRQLLRNEEDALDASQDVFVRVLERRDRLRAEYPSSLLYRMATNLCLNRLRDRRRERAAGDDGLLERIAAAGDHGALSEARSVLGRLFGGEPDSSRVLAVLHYVDGLTLEQVACEVGLSVSGVRKRLRGLRRALRLMESHEAR